jgi:ribosome recycling factor
VPEAHLKKLHEANERFSAARHHREEAIDSASPETTERDKAMDEVREAEKTVEEVTDEIDRDLHPAP